MRLASYLVDGDPHSLHKPPEFLRVGDVMEAEIEQIGVLRNTVATYGD